MHNPEQSFEAEKNPESDLGEIRMLIANAKESIDVEMVRSTGNPWFACVNTQLQGLMALVEFAVEDREITEERGEQLIKRITELASEVKGYLKQYSKPDSEVPEELKEDMYQKLNILS